MYAYRWGRPDSAILGVVILLVLKRFYQKRLPLWVVASLFVMIDVIGWFILPAYGIGLYNSLFFVPLVDIVFSFAFWLFTVWMIKFLPFNIYLLALSLGVLLRTLLFGEGWFVPLAIGVFMYLVLKRWGLVYQEE